MKKYIDEAFNNIQELWDLIAYMGIDSMNGSDQLVGLLMDIEDDLEMINVEYEKSESVSKEVDEIVEAISNLSFLKKGDK